MKLRRLWMIRLVSVVGAWVVRLLVCTLRYHVRDRGQAVQLDDPNLPGRFIYAFWHEAILFLAGAKGKICVLVSQSADGELIAQTIQRLGHRVVRGSSSRGGAQGLWELVTQSRRCHLALAPDGPRGPRRRVKPGTIYVAARTGLPIVPIGIAFAKGWRAHTWDRFAVPWPFTDVVGVAGRVLHVPADLDREHIECYRRELEARMMEATARAEECVVRNYGGKLEKAEPISEARKRVA